MKMERISEHVWSVESWLVLPFHVWLVVDAEGVTLVDAGIPTMAKGILNSIAELGAGPLQRILLTHGHSDHVGSLRTILRQQSVPVYAHELEFPYMTGDLPYPRRKKAETSVANGIAQPLSSSGDGSLAPVAGLKPYWTPGHAPGHVAYYHEQDKVLLAGDLFTSKHGKLNRPMPMFTADMAEALRSSLIVERLNPERVEVCHGKPVLKPAEHLKTYIEQTASKLSIPKAALYSESTIQMEK